jgi:hypothetical protein
LSGSSGVAVPSRLLVSSDGARTRAIVHNIGWGLIGAQLIGLLVWSAHVASRGAMSWDFAAYYQPWWAIAHGHLNPAATVMPGGYPFWRNDGEFIIWLLAPLYWLSPNHELGLWWIQDLALVGITAVCYRWITELLPWDTAKPLSGNVIPAVGWMLTVLLLVLNPWIYWSATFAVQMEAFGVLFALLGLRALMSGRRSVWGWLLLAALCGSASVVYAISVGLTGLLVGLWQRRSDREGSGPAAVIWRVLDWPRAPLAIIVAGVAWLVALGALHATQSFSNPAISVHQDLSYLNGTHAGGHLLLVRTALHALTHPGAVISVIWSHALNLWANTAPAGFVGLFSGVGILMSGPTLLENSILKGQDFSYPGFANLIVYVAVALGTALVVTGVLRRHRRVGLVLAAVLLANAVAWCAIWLPKVGGQYVSIGGTAARTLDVASSRIPAGAEVIASQGFVGKFAGRRDIEVFGGPSSKLRGPEVFPVASRHVWFVLSGDQGIEVPSTSETDQAVGSVAALPGARLVSRANGVWVFSWTAPSSTRSVALGGPAHPVPGWTTGGTSSIARLAGGSRSWSLTSTGAPGYVVSGDIWRLSPGRYVTHVLLSASTPSNVEVWDDGSGTDRLLARRQVVSKKNGKQVTMLFTVPPSPAPSDSTGPAPFAYRPEPPPRAANVEVRVWAPRGAAVTVSRLAVQRAPGMSATS